MRTKRLLEMLLSFPSTMGYISCRSEKRSMDTFVKRILNLSFIFTLSIILSSCDKEGYVSYCFDVNNTTDMPMTVHLSSWGDYQMFINGFNDPKYKFHESEDIKPYSYLGFVVYVSDDSDSYEIPSSLIPAWEYITAIECDGVTIPKEYFCDQENWEFSVSRSPFSGMTSINLNLFITPELIEKIRNNSFD